MTFTQQESMRMSSELHLLQHFCVPFTDGEVWELARLESGVIAVRPRLSEAEGMGFFYMWILTSHAAHLKLERAFCITFSDVENMMKRFQTTWADNCPVDELIPAIKAYLETWQPSAAGVQDSILTCVPDCLMAERGTA